MSAPEGTRRYRSLLYVPGHKLDWALKAPRFGSDALVLDLEDAVPEDAKGAARATCAEAIERLGPEGLPCFVRINPWRSGRLVQDVRALIAAGPAGFLLPKIATVGDVIALDSLLTELELESGRRLGEIEIIPGCESAHALRHFGAICTASTRVRRCPGGPRLSPNGDTSRALDLRWTEGGLEELHVVSHAIFSATAAGVGQILARLTGDIHDAARLRATAQWSRQLGCTGALVVHPNQVLVANEVFAYGTGASPNGSEELSWTTTAQPPRTNSADS